MDVDGPGSWLAGVLRSAEEQARRRGDQRLSPDHLALALARPDGPADAVLMTLGIDPLGWRDQITTVLGWNEGRSAEREGRTPGGLAASPAALRFTGPLALSRAGAHVVALARQEADGHGTAVGPAALLVALLREGESIGAATGAWFGMTVGRVRSASGLPHRRRIVAGGAPPGGAPRRDGSGPMVLCGGASDTALLRQVVALAGGRAGADGPSAVMVDLAWANLPPAPDERRDALGRLTDAGAGHVADAGIADREDAHSPEVCRRLAAADLVWFAGGDHGALYDRLWATPALDAIRHAHERGAVVGGVSAGAMVWGAGTLSSFASDDEPEPFPLFGWLDDLVIFAHYFPVREGEFRARVAAFPGCRGFGLAHGGAVVVGPDGEPGSLQAGSDGSRNVVLSGPDRTLVVL